MAELNLLQRIVSHAFKREFEKIEDYSKKNATDSIVSHDAFLFDNPFTGKIEKYAFKKTTIEDLKNITFWHKNSQYCWLLMSAYEKFEVFLKSSYRIFCGKDSRTLNPILFYFSENFPKLKQQEADNAFGIHLRVAVTLVEKLRHAIAHKRGSVPNIDEFVKKVIDSSGINNNKKLHQEFISHFLVEKKVFILELPANDNYILKLYHEPYRLLVSYLISYAYLVVNAEADK